MHFLPLTLLISVHLRLFQFKYYGLNFTMLDTLQVRAVLLPANFTAELSCSSRVYKDLNDCEFLCFFLLLKLKCKAVQNLLLCLCVLLDLT